jgi:hypothetical protein
VRSTTPSSSPQIKSAPPPSPCSSSPAEQRRARSPSFLLRPRRVAHLLPITL